MVTLWTITEQLLLLGKCAHDGNIVQQEFVLAAFLLPKRPLIQVPEGFRAQLGSDILLLFVRLHKVRRNLKAP